MTYQELKDEEQLYLMHTYGRFPAALDHGKGATLWDIDGKKYIDLTSGIGVSSLGHDNEALVSALNEQAHKLLHASNLYLTEPMVQVAKELVTSCGMGKIFFSNSGAEAVPSPRLKQPDRRNSISISIHSPKGLIMLRPMILKSLKIRPMILSVP